MHARAQHGRYLVTAIGLLSCGDNTVVPCAPDVEALPEGILSDPGDLLAAHNCVANGLRDVLGRWHFVDEQFVLEYGFPRLEGTCVDGFRRSGFDDDTDVSDGYGQQTWSDGTVMAIRNYYRSPGQGAPEWEGAQLWAACLLDDGSMAGVLAQHFPPISPEVRFDLRGRRHSLRGGSSRELELLAELADWGPFPVDRISGNRIDIVGSHVYVAGRHGLDVIDVNDPTQPEHVSHVGRVSLSDSYSDVEVVVGGKRTMAFTPEGDVIDVTLPSDPDFAVPMIPALSISSAAHSGSMLLYRGEGTSIAVYDVTEPTNPSVVGATSVAINDPESAPYAIRRRDDVIFVSAGRDGLVALDVTAGFAMALEVGRATYSNGMNRVLELAAPGGRRVVLTGERGMTGGADGAGFLRIVGGDPNEPTFLEELGRYQSRPQVSISSVFATDNRAYIAYHQDGVRVLDISDPTRPVEIAYYDTWSDITAIGHPFEGAAGIVVANGLVFVADTERGLMIFSDPPDPP